MRSDGRCIASRVCNEHLPKYGRVVEVTLVVEERALVSRSAKVLSRYTFTLNLAATHAEPIIIGAATRERALTHTRLARSSARRELTAPLGGDSLRRGRERAVTDGAARDTRARCNVYPCVISARTHIYAALSHAAKPGHESVDIHGKREPPLPPSSSGTRCTVVVSP